MPWHHAEYARFSRVDLEKEERMLLLWEKSVSVPIPLHLAAVPVSIVSVACGQGHAAALTVSGELFTWGANEFGQLGRGVPQGVFPAPERAYFALHLQALEPRITQVSCGARHTVAITDHSKVLAFGDNSFGQCGYAAGAPIRKVNLVTLQEQVNQPLYGASVSCGHAHTFVLAVHGELYACGDNSVGQLGVGDLLPRSGMTLVIGLLGIPIANVAAGGQHSACVTVSGNVFVWGSNSHGQLGAADAALSVAPFWLQFFSDLGASAARCAANHTFIVCRSGHTYGFGDVARNQICIRHASRELSPNFVCKKPMLLPLKDVCDVAAGEGGGVAMVANQETGKRELWCWGEGVSSLGDLERLNLGQGENFVAAAVAGGGFMAIRSNAPCVDFVPASAPKNVGLFCGCPPPDAPFAVLDGLMGMQMIQMAKQSASSLAVLANYVRFVLSHPVCLNASFLSRESPHTGLVSGLNMNHVRGFFVEVQKLGSKEMFDAMIEGAANALQYLYDHRLAHSAEILRMFLILLDSPLLLNPDFSNRKLLDQILFCMLGLPQILKTTLLTYIGEHPALNFVMPVRTFERYLTFLIQTGGHERSISNCVVFLSYLNQINEGKHHVPFQELYNDALNAMPIPALEQEYWKWRNRQFSFCQYPFLLSASVKSEILQIDATVSMKEQMESAIISSVMRGEGVVPFLVLVVRRENLVADALAQVQSKPTEALKKPLKIKFVGEEGIDAGGVKKEFFQLVIRDILDPNYGMFVYNESQRTFWFNLSAMDMAPEFGLVGTMLGLAIYNSVILDLPFPLLVYKKLCNKPVGMEDVADLDPQQHKNLKALLEYDKDDIAEVFCLDFSVSYDYFGSTNTIMLIPNGDTVPVTQANKGQYVKLYVEWLLVTSIRDQFDSFARGFRAVGGPTLSIFRAEELELLICGSHSVNIDELESATTYKGGYAATHKVIRWFWELVRSWPVEKQKKLLTFATGSDRVPIKGLAAVGFVIQCNTQDTSRLPTASTCFNTLLLPCYSHRDQLREKLELAIENATGFQLK